MPSALARYWGLDPGVTFLNHGSFGACPRSVLAFQRKLTDRIEAQPVRFFVRELEGLLDEARVHLGQFLGAQPQDLVFIPNATIGVNAVVRSLTFKPGDEVLTTNHAYNACKNALQFAAERAGAKTVVADVPFPLRSDDEIVAAVMNAVTPRTRLALLDHVTSPTAVIFPVERLVRELTARGVDTLIDGAHAPGMVPFEIDRIGAAYYTGNCHKWMCAPKGAGFLHVRRDKQAEIRPVSISHGANSPRTDRSRYLIEFDWTGTWDPTAYLSIHEALKTMAGMVSGGWPEIMRHNHATAIAAREMLCTALKVPPPCPEHMLGSMATVALPGAAAPAQVPLDRDPLQDELLSKHQIEVPIMAWKHPPRMVRVACQLYNSLEEYQKLAGALASILKV